MKYSFVLVMNVLVLMCGLAYGTSCDAGTWEQLANTCSLCTFGDGPAPTCNECSAGKWSDATGITSDAECSLCPSGTFSAQTGLTSSTQCETCPTGYQGAKLGAAVDEGATYCISSTPAATAAAAAWIDNRFGHFKTRSVYSAKDTFADGATFRLVSNPGSAFAIDASTGEVKITAMPTYENKAVYQLRVESEDALGNKAVANVTVNVCESYKTAESQCAEAVRPKIAKHLSDARKLGYMEKKLEGTVAVNSVLNPCAQADLSRMKTKLSVLLEIAQENIEVYCKASSAAPTRRRLMQRRLTVTTYTIAYSIIVPGDPVFISSVDVELNDQSTWQESVAAATGEDASDVAILSISVGQAITPNARSDLFHVKYKRASKVYRGLTFPITADLDMLGEGTQTGTLFLNPGAPMPVHVTNLPTSGVTGCHPLQSFYIEVRDKLIATLPYAIEQFSANTGDQEELEGLRRDIENAQKDVHSVSVFCGDLAKVLKIRRNTYHAYTSAWAALSFGTGKLSKFGHGVLKSRRPSHIDIVKHVGRLHETHPDVLLEILNHDKH